MSMMRCDGCGRMVDTDEDPESVSYTDIWGTPCLCEQCREEDEDE